MLCSVDHVVLSLRCLQPHPLELCLGGEVVHIVLVASRVKPGHVCGLAVLLQLLLCGELLPLASVVKLVLLRGLEGVVRNSF